MNFLAHLYLAGDDPEARFGNMLADFVKGRVIDDLTPGLRRGVLHHRCIDAFTDEHPVFLASVTRIRGECGRYSPILVDVFYDHFLAKGWERYHPQALRSYLDDFYRLYESMRDGLPPVIRAPMDGLRKSDRLMTYAEVRGIEAALLRMSQLFSRNPALHLFVQSLEAHYSGLEEDFSSFFPEVSRFAASLPASE